MSGHWARGYLGLAGADQNGGNGGGGAMVLTMTTIDTVGTLDATYAQVKAALRAGTEVLFVNDTGSEVIMGTLFSCQDNGNYANFLVGPRVMEFTANAEDDLLTLNLAD